MDSSLLGAVSSAPDWLHGTGQHVSRPMLSSTVLQGVGGGSPFPWAWRRAGRGAGKPCWMGTWKRTPFSLCHGSPAKLLKVLKCSGSIFCDFKEYKLPFMDESRFEVDPASRL